MWPEGQGYRWSGFARVGRGDDYGLVRPLEGVAPGRSDEADVEELEEPEPRVAVQALQVLASACAAAQQRPFFF